MKHYMLFGSYSYYPQGGFDDFLGFFDTIEEAKSAFESLKKESYYDWYQIIDTSIWKEV